MIKFAHSGVPNPFILKAILAVDEARVIGNKGTLPWHIPEDMKYFSNQTKGHTVLMGRKTYDSLPERYRPLPGRTNIVLSRNRIPEIIPESVYYFNSPADFFNALETDSISLNTHVIWLIGGAELYRELLPHCNEVHITRVPGRHEGDTHLEVFEDSMALSDTIPGESCIWEIYKK